MRRITAVVVVIPVGVVHRIHRVQSVACWRHRRTISVVVVAVGARTVVVPRAGTDVDDHPALGARPFPVERDGLEVFEGSEAVQLLAQFVVGHDGEGVPPADEVGRNLKGDSLDVPRAYLDPFLGIAVAFVGVEVEANAASVSVVANVLNIVVDGDGVGIVDHYGL